MELRKFGGELISMEDMSTGNRTSTNAMNSSRIKAESNHGSVEAGVRSVNRILKIVHCGRLVEMQVKSDVLLK